MKKNLLKVLVIFSIVLLAGCTLEKDNVKFKKEYESLNGKVNASGVGYRSINVDKDNPYVYVSAEEIVKKIDNKETFFLYIGDKQCPWCRSVIETSINVAKEFGIKKIYYINIWDDDHNEILRDKYVLNDKNEPVVMTAGTSAYKKLLTAFDSLLNEYTLTTESGEKVSVNEKRIMAPSYIYVKEGKAIKLTEGIAPSQATANQEMTKEMIEESTKLFRELFALSTTCDENC